ncbi:FecR domain-containing protein [uncultured Alistipes sp.]|uniref:FecR family protein n=1 Tax=uncultured Alistipes sp. TaxID=538949 RepID=UPI00320A8485
MSFETQIKNILKARLDGSITPEEEAVLQEWAESDPQHRALLDLLDESADHLPLLGHLYNYDESRVWRNIRKEARRRRFRKMARESRKYAAVAAVLLFAGYGIWQWIDDRNREEACRAYIEQVTPGVRGAVLTLSSGEQVDLEQGGERTLVEQDGTRIEVAGEEVAYHDAEPEEEEIPAWNTVSVPRGKEFSLQLSDGTKVWLNSASSLRFPVRFGEGPREVVVTGEAFFDVAKDADRQFIVHADTVAVAVYGTAFNIAAYEDETDVETTLLRGSVEVTSGRRKVMLKPGQQARVGRSGAIFDVRQVPAEEYAAWTRGVFAFQEEPLSSICRKLSRWYDIEILPSGFDADQVRYTGEIRRYETFAEMVRLLERTNQIRIDVQDGRILLCIDRDDG